jgi:hypothetical protein
MTFARHAFVRRVLGTTLLLSSLSLAMSPQVRAQDVAEEESQSPEESTADTPPPVRREAGQVAIYIEGATMLLANGAVLSGEVILAEHVAISGGWGVSQYQFFTSGNDHGPRLQFHYLAGRGPRLFELAIGAAWAPWAWEPSVVPTSHIGYRWQPTTNGILFRAGVSFLQHIHSAGLSLSIGTAY